MGVLEEIKNAGENEEVEVVEGNQEKDLKSKIEYLEKNQEFIKKTLGVTGLMAIKNREDINKKYDGLDSSQIEFMLDIYTDLVNGEINPEKAKKLDEFVREEPEKIKELYKEKLEGGVNGERN